MLSARRLSVLLIACVFTPGAALGQEEHPQPQTILAFEAAPLSAWMAHPKDAALERAVMMMPSRLREMPREIPDLNQAPPGVFDLVDIVFQGPYRFVVVSEGSDPETGLPRLSSELAIGSNTQNGAQAAYKALAGFMENNPQFQRVEDGAILVETPIGDVRIGAYQEDGQWWFGARLGNQGIVGDAIKALPNTRGGETLMHASMDLESVITPLKIMGAMMAGGNPEAQAGMAMVESLGLLDAMSLSVDMLAYHNDAGVHAVTTVHDARETLTKMGLGTTPLTAEQLGAIPADALTAMLSQSNPDKLLDLLEMAKSMGPQAQQALDMFSEQTGVDLENDMIRALNGVYGAYSSDATGGSGLLSWVAIAGISDHNAMHGAMEKLTNMANQMAQDIPYGESAGKYLRIAHANHNGADFLTFQTPGVPMPFSPTIAMTNNWLVIGATRQSAYAAAMQAAGQGDGGLLANAAFKEQLSHGLDGVIQIQFLDTPRAIRKGYGMTTLLGGAIENAVRSPLGADREPGMVIPPYHDLVRDSRAMVKVLQWVDDDLVITAHGDGSALVNIAGVAGAYAEPVMMLMAPAVIGAGIAEAVQEGEIAPPF